MAIGTKWTGWIRKKRTAIVLLADVVVLAVFFYLIPGMRRPFEFLMIALFILGMFSILALRSQWLRSAFLAVTVVAATVFGLEMAEKIWSITDRLAGSPVLDDRALWPNRDETRERPYAWNTHSTAEYLAVRDRAIKDGLPPEAFVERFAGDYFPKEARATMWRRRVKSGGKVVTWEGLKERFTYGRPLGFELTPDNMLRYSCKDAASGRMVVDARATVRKSGIRNTRGDDRADDVYVFLGCSVTFGFGVSDDETLPHYFSEATGFRSRVLNLALNNYGPHHALRDLELDYHMGREGVRPEAVRGVYFQLIDDHPRRSAFPTVPGEPRYVLENGKVRFAGVVPDTFFHSRLAILLERGRIYPKIRNRLAGAAYEKASEYNWRLALAILDEVDKICRERYGVRLHVIYRDENPVVLRWLAERDGPHTLVADALGEGWKDNMALNAIYDGHPSPYANKLLGQRVARELEDRAGEGRQAGNFTVKDN